MRSGFSTGKITAKNGLSSSGQYWFVVNLFHSIKLTWSDHDVDNIDANNLRSLVAGGYDLCFAMYVDNSNPAYDVAAIVVPNVSMY